jgi:endonuclease YncB( thermonuclease family)
VFLLSALASILSIGEKMNISFLSRCLLAAGLLLCFQTGTSAATLQAKVTEVDSGNSLVVTNINRPLRVRLKAIAPPEDGQPFRDAARDHLKALILNKAVVVEYTHLSDGYLEAKVILNGIDIGSQMIRDGVAWYDRSFEYALNAADRDLYASCEQAARAENRGLWNDSAAMAPWEFRKAQQAKVSQPETPETFPAIRATTKSRASSRLELSNKYLGAGFVEPGAIAGMPKITPVSSAKEPEDWTTFRWNAPRFSLRVPGNSYLYEYPILDSDLKIISMNYVMGTSDGGVYTLMWTRGSNGNTTDAIAADLTIEGFIKGINQYFQEKGGGLNASFSTGRNIRLGSYAGKQYSISAGGLSGFARVVSRQIGDQREVFAVAVFSTPGDDSGFDFLNSLKFSATGK